MSISPMNFGGGGSDARPPPVPPSTSIRLSAGNLSQLGFKPPRESFAVPAPVAPPSIVTKIPEPPLPPPAPHNVSVRLPKNQMDVYGLQPLRDPWHVVRCKQCSKAVLLVAFAKHFESCQRRAARAIPATPPVPPTVPLTPPTIVKATRGRPRKDANKVGKPSGKIKKSSAPKPKVVPPAPLPVATPPPGEPYRGKRPMSAPPPVQRAAPTPPRVVQQTRVSVNPSVLLTQSSRRKEIAILEIRKGNNDEKVTIMVEGSPVADQPSSPQSPPVSAQISSAPLQSPGSGGMPLASRRWSRRNKLTGLSLSFKVRQPGELRWDDEEPFHQGGNLSEGWAYTSERPRSESARSGASDDVPSPSGKRKLSHSPEPESDAKRLFFDEL